MNKKPLGIYIHIPFCAKKCKYCDFISFDNKIDKKKLYIDKLVEEINNFNKDNYIVETIFIGGGTPSILSSNEIYKLGSAINEFILSRDIEFSVECNPCNITEEKLIAFKDIGVNRISFGLQSYDNELLKIIGRVHNVDIFEKAYGMARKVGFGNINVDIIFNLPSQEMKSYKRTLEKVIALQPEHISCYGLIIEENTPFWDMIDKGELAMPDEDLDREMYEYSENYLSEKGYTKYEISNYAKVGYECKHNIKYWKREEYIGFGLNSHSMINNQRFSNTKNLEKYLNIDFKNLKATKDDRDIEILDLKAQLEEYIFLGLRLTEGVNILEIGNILNISVYDIYKEVIDKFKNNGLLEFDGRILKLTKKGVSISNYVLSEFIL